MNTRSSQPSRSSRPNGLTMVELVVVLAILVALAGLVVPRLQSTSQHSADVASTANLVAVRDAFTQYWLDTKHVALYGPPATAASDTDTTAFDEREQPFSVAMVV